MAFEVTYAGSAIPGVESWQEEVPSRVSPEVFPRRHGSILQEVVFLGPRTVRIAGTIVSSNETALRNTLTGIGRITTEAGREKLTLRDDDRYLRALKSNFGYTFQAAQAPTLVSRYTMEFVADDPFWYAPTEWASSTTIAASTTTFSVTNSGGVKTPPTIEFLALSNAITNVRLSNTTIGQTIQVSSTVASGNILTVNHKNYTVMNAGASAINDFTGTFFLLEPGVNNMEFLGPTGTSVRIYFTDRWA